MREIVAHRRPRRPARPPAAGPRRADQPARSASPIPRSWPRCASRSPTAPGAAAEVFTLAAELGVNIASFEVVHLAESNVGVAVVLVDADVADLFRGGLIARGFRPAVTPPELTVLTCSATAAPGPLDAVVDGARLEEHRQPGARLRRPGRRRQRAARRARRRRHRGDGRLPAGARRRRRRSTGDRGASSPARGGRLDGRAVRLDAGLAGTTSRFVTAVAALGRRAGHDRRRAAAAAPADGPAARRPRRPRRRRRARRGAGRPAGDRRAARCAAAATVDARPATCRASTSPR